MQAVAKGTKIINEDGLINLINAAPAPPEKPEEEGELDDEIAFVSSTAAAPKASVSAPKASSLAAELNKVRASNTAPKAGPSQPLPLGRLILQTSSYFSTSWACESFLLLSCCGDLAEFVRG